MTKDDFKNKTFKLGSAEMAQWVKHLQCVCQDWSLVSSTHITSRPGPASVPVTSVEGRLADCQPSRKNVIRGALPQRSKAVSVRRGCLTPLSGFSVYEEVCIPT